MKLNRISLRAVLIVLAVTFVSEARGADPATNPTPASARAAFGRPIVLGPDDKQVFPDPPAGFRLTALQTSNHNNIASAADVSVLVK